MDSVGTPAARQADSTQAVSAGARRECTVPTRPAGGLAHDGWGDGRYSLRASGSRSQSHGVPRRSGVRGMRHQHSTPPAKEYGRRS